MTVTQSPAAIHAPGASAAFEGVRRSFGQMNALDSFSLAIEPGELLALLGPSGCGKTTALRILAGFDRPTSGSVLVDRQEVSGVPTSKRDMGMVFQSYSLFPTMSALDNVAFGLRVRKLDKAKRRRTAGDLLELVGLGAHTLKFPHQLSGGQQQRVALARALAIQPRLLLLDEPLSALDAKVREQLRDEIRRIQTDVGVTTVIVTHDQEEALSMADRVAVMNSGRLEQVASPSALYERPATAFVAEFVGTMNRITGVMETEQSVRVLGKVLPIEGPPMTSGSSVSVLVRPEALVPQGATGHWTVLAATFRGATTRLRLGSAEHDDVLVDIAAQRAAEFPVGGSTGLELPDRPVLVAA
ncbi:MAG TPA: ABC transporter ATP-binding protein [Marmoricola sp.]|nr:ABC transporter ATP-binding protein [Marmoricola sp.]